MMSEIRHIQHLADQPVGGDQLTRARELCGRSDTLNAKLDEFLSTKPTRGQMLDFMEELRLTGLQVALESNIRRICDSVGIAEPSGTDKLLALQIGLLREQNDILTRAVVRAGQAADHAKDSASTGSGLLTGFLLGKLL